MRRRAVQFNLAVSLAPRGAVSMAAGLMSMAEARSTQPELL
jgi:hypothetical protein